jgi:hypothetical protein
VQNYGAFLQDLRQSPQLLASCLASAEKVGHLPASFAHTLLGSLFGGCVFAEDEHLMLQLMLQLITLQVKILILLKHFFKKILKVVANPEPARTLRPGACIFSRLYCAWNEALFAGKVFLTGALHDPVLHILSEDDAYWDADIAKSLSRYAFFLDH